MEAPQGAPLHVTQTAYQAKQATLTGGLANFLLATVGIGALRCVAGSCC